MAATTYYVKKLPENPVNNNKWIYIDSSDGNVKIEDNKWYFDIKLYIIQNLSLPVNTFSLDMSSQIIDIKDLDVNTTLIDKVPDWVKQPTCCKAYETKFSIDTNECKLFEQALTNYKLALKFKLDVDTKIIDEQKLSISDTDMKEFLGECYTQESNLSFLYSNYDELKQDKGSFSISNGYYLNSTKDSYSEDSTIYYSLNNETKDTDQPIKNLLSIDFDSEYTIEAMKVHFTYEVFGKAQKDLEYEVKDPYYGNTKKEITYDSCTYYNEAEGEVKNQVSGIQGFYIPVAATGIYEVSIKLNYKNATKNLKFINNFNFKGNSDYINKKIYVSQCFINSLDGFEGGI